MSELILFFVYTGHQQEDENLEKQINKMDSDEETMVNDFFCHTNISIVTCSLFLQVIDVVFEGTHHSCIHRIMTSMRNSW